MSSWSDWAFGAGVGAFLLFVLAEAANLGYLSATQLLGLTPASIAVLGVLATIAAIAFGVRANQSRGGFGG